MELLLLFCAMADVSAAAETQGGDADVSASSAPVPALALFGPTNHAFHYPSQNFSLHPATGDTLCSGINYRPNMTPYLLQRRKVLLFGCVHRNDSTWSAKAALCSIEIKALLNRMKTIRMGRCS